MKARRIIKSFRPDVAVGTGGYASGPVLYVASRMGIPTLIQEQNSFPGITNKILAKRVDKICVAYPKMGKYFPNERIMLTGNPVRQDILSLEGKREEALKFFGLEASKKTLLVIGGSLGAETINESIAGCVSLLSENNIQIIWQTGKNYKNMSSSYNKGGEGAIPGGWAGAFISRMDLAYAASDIVVSRAGASSLSELAIVQKPCILVPSPNVAEDHQTKNAMALVNSEAALIVTDVESRLKLGKQIVALMNDSQTQKKLGENIGKLAFPQAAVTIANEVIRLMKKKQ